jgi:hypothetical protein
MDPRRLIVTMSRIATALAFVVACVGRDLAAQSRPRGAAGLIDGVISDTSLAPLAEATITIVGTDTRVVTGANGRFRFASIPAGDYTLLARHIGYEAATTRITVADLDTVRISIALEPVVAALDTVKVAAHNVTPRLAEFYDRRKLGFGQFFTQDEIEKINPVTAADLFRRFSGISVTPDGRRGRSTRLPIHPSPGKPPDCPIMAIVDGVAKQTDFGQLPSPRDIAGIEFFAGPSEIPLQYKSTDGTWCGLILIWTRDGSSPARDTSHVQK